MGKPITSEEAPKCRGKFQVAQQWAGAALEPEGVEVSIRDATCRQGVRTSYVGPLYNEPKGHEVAYDLQLCERLDKAMHWHCSGTYVDLYGCHGKLTYSGFHQDKDSSGQYVITGGTDDFLGVTGHIEEEYDYDGYYIRYVYIS
ncbi:hypothetical protein ACA910_004550 [Epithemia clementina (nom. ined.)]